MDLSSKVFTKFAKIRQNSPKFAKSEENHSRVVLCCIEPCSAMLIMTTALNGLGFNRAMDMGSVIIVSHVPLRLFKIFSL